MNRKKLAIILPLLLTACGTTRQDRCRGYEAAYALYQQTAKVRKPSAEEISTAQLAAVFLRTYCGWQATRGADANGVPVLRKAKK